MASITASIELYDRMSAPLHSMMSAMDSMISTFESMNSAMDSGFDVSTIDDARNAIDEAASEMDNLEEEIRQAGNQQEKFDDDVNKTNGSADKLCQTFEKIGTAIAGMFAINKVFDFVQDSMDAFDTQLNAETQLAAVLRNNVEDVAGAYDVLTKKAASIQGKGIYGDEAMIGAAGEFATYFKDTDAIEMMMDTLSNYAMGMSGGGEINTDAMVQYATNLGKIMTGSYDAMTKKGFEFSDEQKAIIEGTADQATIISVLGDEYANASAELQSAAVINQVIDESWAGLYETMSQTPEGKIIQLKNAFGDLQEVVGGRLYQSVVGVADTINNNWETVETVINGFAGGIEFIIGMLGMVAEWVFAIAGFFSDNWSVIEPIVWGIVTALGAYVAISTIVNIMNGIMAASAAVHAAAEAMQAGATFAATAAQYGLNAALAACPLTWIIVLVIALVAAIIAICQWIANATGVANSWFGVMTGGINVVIQFFKNLGLTVANIALGIWEALGACCTNIGVAFNNVICNVQSWFYNLLSTALTVVAGICEALNKLPFVEFDYSGITSMADNYASKASEAAGNKEEYTSVSDAFNNGMSTFDTFQDGWASDAFSSGAAWGDGVADSVSGALKNTFSTGSNEILNGLDMLDYGGSLDGIGESAADAANSAGKCADSVDISNENLKYLRDIAETEAINRFTTAEIKVDMTNNNNISSGMDIDGMISSLTDGVNEAMEQAAEGVH